MTPTPSTPSAARRAANAVLVAFVLLAACGQGDLEVGVPDRPVCASGQIDGGNVDGDPLVVYNWADYIHPEAIAEFERLNGVTVRLETIESNETLLSEVQARADAFDVIVAPDYMVDILRRDGLLHQLDSIALPGRINLDPLFESTPFDPKGEFSVPYLWGTFGLGVNVNVVGRGVEPTWGLVFDPVQSEAFAGRVSLLDDPRQAMAASLIYLGYSPNTRSTREIAEAAALIQAAKRDLAGFVSDGYAQQLADGALDVAHGRSDAFFGAFDAESSDFAYLIPEEGTIAWVDNLVVPVTAAHPCTAHAFIDFLLEPRNAADLANFTRYASPNLEARTVGLIDEELLTNPAIYPPAESQDTFQFLVDIGELELTYIDEFIRAQGS